jgi:hypothetical protein
LLEKARPQEKVATGWEKRTSKMAALKEDSNRINKAAGESSPPS